MRLVLLIKNWNKLKITSHNNKEPSWPDQTAHALYNKGSLELLLTAMYKTENSSTIKPYNKNKKLTNTATVLSLIQRLLKIKNVLLNEVAA